MKCKNCGEEVANDSVFCEHCGTRVVEEQDETVLKCLQIASVDNTPMAAYKARGRCYKLCKKEHPYNYKEYVNQLMKDKYPRVLEKCNIDTRYKKNNTILTILFAVSILMGTQSGGVLMLLGWVGCVSIAINMAFSRKWYNNELKKYNSYEV